MKKIINFNQQLFSPHLELIMLGFFSFLTSFLYEGYKFGHGNHGAEIPPVYSMINSELYLNDFAIQDFLLPGVRYLYYTFLAECSKLLSIDVDFVLLFVKIFSQISFYIALAYIFNEVLRVFFKAGYKHNMKSIFAFGFFFIACTFPLLSWGSSIFYAKMIPSTLAMGIAIWSLYFAIKQKWFISFAISGCAVPIQFLVGLYSALVLIPGLILNSLRRKSLSLFIVPIFILMIPCISIFIVSVLMDKDVPNTFNFFKVFGEFRHPHHWFPSSAPWFWWVSDLFMLIGSLIASSILWKTCTLGRNIIILLIGMVFISVIGILINFLFVEIFPVLFIGKLQFQRCMPFGHLAIFLIITTNFYSVFIINKLNTAYTTKKWTVFSLILLLPSIFYYSFLSLKSYPYLDSFFWLFFILGYVIYSRIKKYHIPFLIMILLLISFILNSSFIHNFKKVLPRLYTLVTDHYIPLNTPHRFKEENISRWLNKNTPLDTLIIIPPHPNEYSNILALNSKRSIFFSLKNIPYSNYGVWQWSQRLEVLLGTSFFGLTMHDLRDIWKNRTQEEISAIAKKNNACYLVDLIEDRLNFDYQLIIKSKNEKWGLWIFDHCNI